jgi:AraC-like DNA-binding protein
MARHRGIAVQALGFAADDPVITEPVMREHAHSEIELNLVVDEGLRYLFAGRALPFPTHRWIAYWGALPHGVLGIDGPCGLLWVTVPVATVLAWDERGALAQELLRGAIVIEPEERPGAVERARELVAMVKSGGERRRIATLELEALVRRLALSRRQLAPATGTSARARPGRDGNQAAVESMAAWLASHYREEVAIDRCAAAAGLHPNYAMAVFRRATGATLGQYLARLRLAHAQRLLLTSEREVLDIALDAGFGSQARFYVAFKRAFGTTPAAFRRARRS